MTTTHSAAREPVGLLLTGGFVLCGALRDVYFSRTLQTWSPLDIAALTFTISTLVFLTVAMVRGGRDLVALIRWPREIIAINATSATAWIAFFYALQSLEPSLVQVIWAGSGPLAIKLLERAGVRLVVPTRLGVLEQWGLAAVGLVVALAGLVAVLGLSATDPGRAAFGVGLAMLSGAAISVNILLCKRLHECGVAPVPLLSVRFIGVVVVALACAPFVRSGPTIWSSSALPHVAMAAVMLIVLPLYLNQRGIALASPLTVRVVHAAGPVLVFALQFVDGRLPASPWSLAVVIGYSASAALSATARQWRVAVDARRESGARHRTASARGEGLALVLPEVVTQAMQTQHRGRTERYLELDLRRLDGFATGGAMRAAAASRPYLSRLLARQLARLDHRSDPSADVVRVHYTSPAVVKSTDPEPATKRCAHRTPSATVRTRD
jgi:drug/metabolite transporter (DMT)-like permease